MSGWIKWEKDLETDPRVLRMARELKRSCNALAFHPVTLVCGGLLRIWAYADSHIRGDDTLDLGVAELDELIGIPGFCSMMPDDWLQEVDEKTVKLPGFQAHNGIEAKKKALTQKRVETHRKRSSVTETKPCNGHALPDQDQTRPRPEEQNHVSAVPTARVFEHWKQIHGHPKAQLDPKRRKVIEAALKAYSPEDLCRAIEGYKNSPHHMGENDRKTVYDDIEIFLRDAKHIDAGIKFAEKGRQVRWQ